MIKKEKDFKNNFSSFEEFKKYVDKKLDESLDEVDNGNYKPIESLFLKIAK